MPVSEETYQRVALEDPEGQWELVCGRLREKPPMTTEHNQLQSALHEQLVLQLVGRPLTIRGNAARLRVASGSHYVPDICVIPLDYVRRLRERPGTFEVYDAPMPLVVEIWSPSTGAYDLETKVPEYQRRGDAEIWRIHPYDRTVTIWRRQPEGGYIESVHRGGAVQLAALPNVTVDIARLFE